MKCLVAFLAFWLTTTPALAISYKFTAQGTLGSPYSVDKSFNQIATPAMLIGAGSSFSISFTIDPISYYVTGLYDLNPSINIYYGSVSNYNIKIGSYNNSYSENSMLFSSIQLWDNFISGSQSVDSFSISALAGIGSPLSPVSLGNGTINETFGFYAYDFSATARSSDLISELTPLTGISSQSGYIGYINSATYDQTTFSIFELTANVVEISSIPEISSWVTFIFGFGFVGYSLRRHHRIRDLAMPTLIKLL